MGDFEKHRDLLVQEISNTISSIVLNMQTLNRSLNNSIQVSKDFENVSNLWSNFYNGLKEQQSEDIEEEEAPSETNPESQS